MKPCKLIWASLAAFSIGCGGGGGSANLSDVEPVPTLVAYQSGDSWEYDISGTYRDEDGSRSFTGTLTRNLMLDTFDGGLVFKLTATLTLSPSGLPTQSTISSTWFRQLPDRSVVLLARRDADGTLKRIISGATPIPGTWYRGLPVTSVRWFDNGETETYRLTVVGSQRVSVPAGSFNAWKTVETTSYSTSDEYASETSYYALEVGEAVLSQGTLATDDFTIQYTARLRRTSVPH